MLGIEQVKHNQVTLTMIAREIRLDQKRMANSLEEIRRNIEDILIRLETLEEKKDDLKG